MTPENIIIGSNATHAWETYFWPYYADAEPIKLDHGAGELWLNNNLGMVVMSFEPLNNTRPPRPPQCLIDVLSDAAARATGKSLPNQQSSYWMLGFDGWAYPMPNAGNAVWPLRNPYAEEPGGGGSFHSHAGGGGLEADVGK